MSATLWFWFGLALCVSELLIPGLVVIFLGLAALCVALCTYLGWLLDVNPQLTAWFGISLAMVLGLRRFVEELLPGERERVDTDEDRKRLGLRVVVTEACDAETGLGRVLVDGVEWAAQIRSGTLTKGQHAVVRGRDNLTLLVEAAPDEAPASPPFHPTHPS